MDYSQDVSQLLSTALAWTKLVSAMTAVRGVTCRALADWLHMLQAMIAVLYVRVSGCTLCIPHSPFLFVAIIIETRVLEGACQT